MNMNHTMLQLKLDIRWSNAGKADEDFIGGAPSVEQLSPSGDMFPVKQPKHNKKKIKTDQKICVVRECVLQCEPFGIMIIQLIFLFFS